MAAVKPILVFFGLETSVDDYKNDCDISQIVMKCVSSTFNKYIDPTMEISKDMTKINHLEIRHGQIYKDKVMKRSWPLNVVLEEMYQYLKKLNGPCTLIAHKCCFVFAALLIRAIKDLAMEKKFHSVIAGFTDTFHLFQTKFPDVDSKKLNIHAMGREINLRAQQPLSFGRSIKDNIRILEKLALHHFSAEELRAKRSFHSQLKSIGPFTAKMSQAACCPVVVDSFVVEKVASKRPLNENKALKDQAEKTKKHKVSSELEGEVENLIPDKTADDLLLMRDDEPMVTDRKLAKDRSRKVTKKGKAKISKK